MTNAAFNPRCAAERWAGLVLNARFADADLKTLELWARFVGMSRTSLCDSCRMVRVEPRDARDLARVLRACEVALREHARLESVMDVRDSRTLARILARAGFGRLAADPMSLTSLLERQRFVPADNDGLRALKRLVECLTADRAPTAGTAMAHSSIHSAGKGFP